MEIVSLFLGVALLAAMFKGGMEFEREEAKRRAKAEEEEAIDLGIIAPIAGLWAAGKLDDDEAVREVRRSCITRKTPLDLWLRLTRDEKLDLATRYVRLTQDPAWQAQQAKARKQLEDCWTEIRRTAQAE